MGTELNASDMPGYMRMPVLMEEQEAAGKKDKYIEIVDTLAAAEPDVKSTEEKCSYLKALADTLEHMDFQIYELYRKLQDIFKAVLKDMLSQYENLGGEEHEKLSEVISKACRIGILLEEKYTKYVIK